jgi:hypothetical protein
VLFSIVDEDGRLAVSSPYHPSFPLRARDIGGEWDAARHVWFFDTKDRDRVIELCREIYGAVGHNSGAAPPHYSGHRQRLRERMTAAGPDSLPDYELLEMLLFAGYRRGDVKPMAKDLLAQFGGFGEVMSAEPDALAAARAELYRRCRDQIGARGGAAADALRAWRSAGRQVKG